MQHNDVDMQLIMLKCNIFISTSSIIMSTCDIIMLLYDLYHENTILVYVDINKSNVNVFILQQQSTLHVRTDVCHHSTIRIVLNG